MISQSANGLFSLLPLGFRVVEKIKKIIRRELDKIGANEMILPYLSPRNLWDMTGRWSAYGPELIRIKDRKEREYALVPTAEADFLNLISKDKRSYKDFPLLLYQIAEKFRDEIRPRFGLVRARQFIMKDAYSFHSREECLNATFNKFKEAYIKIFEALGLKFKVCEADTGAIGGDASLEFIVLTDAGEAEVAYCECGYAANLEKAESKQSFSKALEGKMTNILTPDIKTMDDLSSFGIPLSECIKSLVVKSDNNFYLFLLRGDRKLNEYKAKALLKSKTFSYASEDDLEQLKLVKGFIGPVSSSLKIVADKELEQGYYCCGANKKNYHLKNVLFDRDWKADYVENIRTVDNGDECKLCSRALKIIKGIEVGHIFKIGSSYSKAMDRTFITSEAKEKNILMASYGIGVSRLFAALAEQESNGNVVKLPKVVAPFEIGIIIVNMKDEEHVSNAYEIYEELKEFDVLLDDRDLSIGYKIKDLELIGVPIRLVVGNNCKRGEVEILTSNSKVSVKRSDLLSEITNLNC